MKIFLIYSAINCANNFEYSYGLGYIAAVLKKNGGDVDYIIVRDEESIAELYERIKEKQPQIIGFSATTSQFNYLKDITKKVRQISDGFIVCGGIHPTMRPESIFEIPELDAIARGEGEFPLLELAKSLENNEDHSRIKNFWFRRKDSVIKNEIRPLIEDIDELPFIDKSSLDYQQVIDRAGGVNGLIFSRGCPFNCAYCSNKALSEIYPDKTNYVRQRSPQKAIEEIETNMSRFKFKVMYFEDDIISLSKKWFYEFFNLYKKEFRFPFRCNLRVGTVDRDMLKLLKEAGIAKAMIGVEHGNERFRKDILKRNISDRQIIETFRLCDRHDIAHGAFVMVGLPYETNELFLDTVRLCRKIGGEMGLSIFHPYPGTELGALCEKNGWVPKTEYFKEREEAVIDYPDFPKEEIQLCAEVFRYLVRFKCIPLKISLRYTVLLFRFLRGLKRVILYFPRKLKRTLA